MANKYILSISDNYPESYWFKCKVGGGVDGSIFKEGVSIGEPPEVEFVNEKKVSIPRLMEYDFLYSDGPNLISPRLYQLLAEACITGVQFIDAQVIIAGQRYDGYKIFNVTSRAAVFDKDESIGEPLISYLPDGPKYYKKIVLNEGVELNFDIVRAAEQFTTIIASKKLAELCNSHEIIGLKFVEDFSEAM